MMEPQVKEDLPVVVIGAGPMGLVTAAHLSSAGLRPVVLEAGKLPGTSIRAWAHVRVFSPWKNMVDPLSRQLLERSGWRMPREEILPTGGEFIASFLEPLAELPAIASAVRYGQRVIAVSRFGFDKVRSEGREAAPFEVISVTKTGEEARILARAVIDASGTYASPNRMGSGGVSLAGEPEQSQRIYYGTPDVAGQHRNRYRARHSLVIGGGHSAFNALLDLAALQQQEPETKLTWAVRSQDSARSFGSEEPDFLPAREMLGARLRRLVDRGSIELVTGFRASHLEESGAGAWVRGGDRTIGPVQEIIVATGYRPDLEMLRELRLALDPTLESAALLAPLIDPNVHSCGTVPKHGAVELEHPEPDFFIIGMKSFGRAPTFLLQTGYGQVRSVVAALSGHPDATAANEPAESPGGCCGPVSNVSCSTPRDTATGCPAPGAGGSQNQCGP